MGNISFEQVPAILMEILDRLCKLEQGIIEIAEPRETGPIFMDVSQAAIFLNLAESTIYSKVCRGQLPSLKRGKHLYFDRSELVKWLMEGRRKTAEERFQEAQEFFKNKSRR